jgi:hypothetical protein
MGYTVRYPKAWTVTPATEPWKPDDSDFWDEPNGDRIESEAAGFRGGSTKPQQGQTTDEWIKAYLGPDDESCGVREEIPLGAGTATVNLNGCAGLGRLGGRVYDVVVGIGDRVYNFTLEGEVDRGVLDAFLATVEFHPGAAVD